MAEVMASAATAVPVELKGWLESLEPMSDGIHMIASVRYRNQVQRARIRRDTLAQLPALNLQTVVKLLCTWNGAGSEVTAHDVSVIAAAEPLPVDLSAPDLGNLRYRHLHIRTPALRATAMFRHFVQKYIREYFDEHGFFFVNTPIITGASCVCSGDVFTFPYYNRQVANLIQSPWMYADALVAGVEKVYTINTSYRREKVATNTHLVEIVQAQVDLTWASNFDVMALEEGLVQRLARFMLERHADLYEMARLSPDHLDSMTKPFVRSTYDECRLRLRELGHEIAYGKDWSKEQSEQLSATYDRPYFITDFPKRLKNFWFPTTPGTQDLTPSNDLYAHTGHGEIIGGGERVFQLSELLANLEYYGHDEDEYRWYVETRRFGCAPHAGFSIGFDRLVAWLMNVEHIHQATLIPRLPHGTLSP